MSIASQYTQQHKKPGKKKEAPLPAGALPRFFVLLRRHFFKMAALNLLFVMCCLPVVTIPAAVCALNRYLILMARDGEGFSLQVYFSELKAELLRSLPLGILCGGLYALAGYLVFVAPNSPSATPTQNALGLAGAILCVLLSLLLGGYGFTMMSLLDISAGAIIKNALILVLCEPMCDLGIILTGVLTLGPIIIFFPWSLAAAMLVWFALPQLVLMLIVNPVMERRILKPYAEQQGGTDANE